MQPQEMSPEQAFRALRAVWYALLASTGSYAVVGWVLASALGPLDLDPTSLVRLVLQAAALGTAVIAAILGRLLLQPARLASVAAGARSPYQQIIGQHVLVFAVAEAPAMLGLVLYLIGGATSDLLIFVALGVLALLLVYPQRSRWDATVAALRRQP